MPPRTLASLAHALTVAADSDTALGALAEALAELDRFAQLALVRIDPKRSMLRDRLLARDGTVTSTPVSCGTSRSRSMLRR